MAQLVGHLSADFSSFTKAVDESVVKLKGFETNAAKVGDSLEKMGNKFSGQKVIQEATLMADIFAKMGGAAAFTEKELQQMGKTGAEALEKMRAQGMEIPANLQKMADGTKQAEKATVDWKSALLATAGAFGVAFSVNAIKDFALSVVDTAGKIGDMSEKLGISAEAVQRFGYAADQGGASIDTVDSAIKKMNANLAEGSKSTVAALAAAGLEFKTIRQLSPEQAFEAIADAVAGIEDPMQRAKVATELFGQAGQELLPAFLAGIGKVGDETDVMSDKTVERLKAAQDAWASFYNYGVTKSGEWLAAVMADAETWLNALIALGKPPKQALEWFKSFRDQSAAATQSVSDLGAMAATVTAPVVKLADAGNGLKMTDEQLAATIGYLNANLVEAVPKTQAVIDAEKRLQKTREELAAMTKIGAGGEFAWQNALALTKFKADQLTISETQLTEATTTLADFVASHQGEMFPEPPQGSLDKWKQGELAILKIVPATSSLQTQIGLLSQSFANLGQIGGAGLNTITRGLGSVIAATDVAFKSVSTFKTGFSELGKGSMLSGIASITSGIGGIVAAASAAISAVKALWSWAKGGEEGQVVNPARDQWFAGRSVQDVGDQLAPYMGGEEARRLIESVFNAKNKQDFGAATGAIDRILAGQNSFAAGTGGFKDFGSGTLALLHGREAVVPEGGSLGGNVVIQINAQGAFFDTPGDLQRLADKVNDALTAKYGLTNRARAA